MRKGIVWTVICVLIACTGCVGSPMYYQREMIRIQAENMKELQESKAAYKDCLKHHPDDISKCDALKKAYEADLNSMGPRGNVTINEENK